MASGSREGVCVGRGGTPYYAPHRRLCPKKGYSFYGLMYMKLLGFHKCRVWEGREIVILVCKGTDTFYGYKIGTFTLWLGM